MFITYTAKITKRTESHARLSPINLYAYTVCDKFAHTASDGKTDMTQFYSLDAAISVVIASIASELLSSASGPQVYFVSMPFVVMCWTGNEWRMTRSWVRTTLLTF